MHYHLEIIMPPVDNVKSAVDQILNQFNENWKDEDGDRNPHSFYDWYVIGGRWAGEKLEAMVGAENIEKFTDELNKREVTVSSLTAGKQTLMPESQIPMVDALWNEFFPDSPVKVCPLFSHFNDQYKNSNGFPDIMPLKDVPKSLTACHVIIAGPSWRDNGELQAKHMITDSVWNGVNYIDIEWDKNVLSTIEKYKEKIKDYKPDYAAKHMPQDDWLVVTVDYHS